MSAACACRTVHVGKKGLKRFQVRTNSQTASWSWRVVLCMTGFNQGSPYKQKHARARGQQTKDPCSSGKSLSLRTSVQAASQESSRFFLGAGLMGMWLVQPYQDSLGLLGPEPAVALSWASCSEPKTRWFIDGAAQRLLYHLPGNSLKYCTIWS